MRPMLATKGTHVPGGGEWLHEVKWDGMRVLVEVRPTMAASCTSAPATRRTSGSPSPSCTGSPASAATCCSTARWSRSSTASRPSVRWPTASTSARPAARRLLAETNPVTLLVFDLLRLDGEDLTGRPLTERRELLEGLGLLDVHWQVPATYDDGEMLLEATAAAEARGHRQQEAVLALPARPPLAGLAEVPAPRPSARTSSGAGVTRPTAPRGSARCSWGSRPTDGLVYRGRVGSGIAGKEGQRLLGVLGPLLADESPFADEVPKVDALGTVWVRPEVVVDIAALGHDPGEAAAPAVVPRRPHRPDARRTWRSPRWLRRRAEEVMVDVGGRTLKISNLAKVMYPTTGTTKGEVLNYYARVSPVLLPHLADRAVTRIRWPHGTGDMQFFEKNLPSGAPSWLHSVTVPSTGSRGGGDTIVFPVIDGLADLTYFANLASLELHVHQWTVGQERAAEEPEPDGHRPRPRPSRRPAGVLPGRAAGARQARGAGPVRGAGDLRQQGPAPVRRAARQAQLRRGARPGPGDRAGAHRRSTRSWWSGR